jgi:hypothetical protein
MSTNASKGFGTTFVFDGVTIGEVMGFPEATSQLDGVDILTCDSADETADFLEGAFSEGEPSFQFIYNGAQNGNYHALHNKFRQKKRGDLVVAYKNRAGTTSSITVPALIRSLSWPGFGSPRDAKVATVGFKTLAKKTFTHEGGGTESASPSASRSTSASLSKSASPSSSASA